MIFVIMNYGVNRNQAGRGWQSKAVAFGLAATLAGLIVGAALGSLGLAVPTGWKTSLASMLAFAGIAVGIWQSARGPIPVLQRSCETAQLWMNTGALTGSALNGAALGAGFVTRVGYWIWYAVPATAFLAGPLKGMLIFGVYGLVRGAAPGLAIAQMLARKSCDQKDIIRVQEWLMHQAAPAWTVSNVALLGSSVFIATVILL